MEIANFSLHPVPVFNNLPCQEMLLNANASLQNANAVCVYFSWHVPREVEYISHLLCVKVLHKLQDSESITPHSSVFQTKTRTFLSLTFPLGSWFLYHVFGLSLNPGHILSLPLLKRGPHNGRFLGAPSCFFSGLCLGFGNSSANSGSQWNFFTSSSKNSTGKNSSQFYVSKMSPQNMLKTIRRPK